jgi:hypothetical protein
MANDAQPTRSERRRASQARYNRSEKGRARHRRYNESDKGYDRSRRYDLTAKGMRRKIDYDIRRGRDPYIQQSALEEREAYEASGSTLPLYQWLNEVDPLPRLTPEMMALFGGAAA